MSLFECRYENVQFLVVGFVHFFSANKCMCLCGGGEMKEDRKKIFCVRGFTFAGNNVSG